MTTGFYYDFQKKEFPRPLFLFAKRNMIYYVIKAVDNVSHLHLRLIQELCSGFP